MARWYYVADAMATDVLVTESISSHVIHLVSGNILFSATKELWMRVIMNTNKDNVMTWGVLYTW